MESTRESYDPGTAHGPLIKKIGSLIELTNEETSCIGALHANAKEFEPGNEILSEGQKIEFAFVQTSGWAYRYKMLADGRRQILNFVLPGDIMGIYGAIREIADESVMAHTNVRGYAFDPLELVELFGRCPRVGVAISWLIGRNDATMAEQVLRVGRRTAYERTGHLILELLKRLRQIGDAESKAFELQVTQELLADCLGLSVVHVNRTLRKFRENGIVHFDGNRLLIDDYEKLMDVTEFHGGYLEPKKLPQKTEEALDGV